MAKATSDGFPIYEFVLDGGVMPTLSRALANARWCISSISDADGPVEVVSGICGLGFICLGTQGSMRSCGLLHL